MRCVVEFDMPNFMSSSLAVICENLKILAMAHVDTMGHWLYHCGERRYAPDTLRRREIRDRRRKATPGTGEVPGSAQGMVAAPYPSAHARCR
jgi:hypothetical protein